MQSLQTFSRIPSIDPENPPMEEISVNSLLLNLVQLRVAIINDCALCVGHHAKTLRENGERELRLQQIRCWQRSHLFSAEERAALALTDALVTDPNTPVSSAVIKCAKTYFKEADILQLVLAIFAANEWSHQAQLYPR